jgi:hypothetical protein
MVHVKTDSANAVDGLRLRMGPIGGPVDTGGTNYARTAREMFSTSFATELTPSGDSIWLGRFTISGGAGDANHFGHHQFIVLGWEDTYAETTIRGESYVHSTVTNNDNRIDYFGGQWKNTAKLGILRFYPTGGNFVAGSKFKVYAKR